jgi:hypothetical protein
MKSRMRSTQLILSPSNYKSGTERAKRYSGRPSPASRGTSSEWPVCPRVGTRTFEAVNLYFGPSPNGADPIAGVPPPQTYAVPIKGEVRTAAVALRRSTYQ